MLSRYATNSRTLGILTASGLPQEDLELAPNLSRDSLFFILQKASLISTGVHGKYIYKCIVY